MWGRLYQGHLIKVDGIYIYFEIKWLDYMGLLIIINIINLYDYVYMYFMIMYTCITEIISLS